MVINEILYHQDPNNTGDEFIELYNRGGTPVDLTGWIVDGGVDFAFPDGTILLGGAYLVIARDATAAGAFYGVTNILGNYVGRLDNGDDTIRLKDNGSPRRMIDFVSYDDSAPWPSEADGGGASLELISPDVDNNTPANWSVGQPYSPGVSNKPGVPGGSAIVINEIMYLPQREELREKFDAVNAGQYYEAGDDELGEYVELFNRGTHPVDLAGWAFTEGIAFTFPPGTVVAAGAHLVVAAVPQAVTLRFGITNVVGPFVGVLDDGGERLTLRDALGWVADTVRYNDRHPWPVGPDEFGYSLECINPHRDNSTAANWRASRGRLAQAHVAWQTITATGIAMSDKLFVALNGAGEWLVDQVEVRPAVGGANLLANGSFEPDDSGWTKVGNHSTSRRTDDAAFDGRGSFLVIAQGAGDGESNYVGVANVPGITIGQSYTITCRASFQKGADAVTIGFAGAGFSPLIAASGGIHNLAKDWSDWLNPSYGWSYRHRTGTVITARVARWRTADLGTNQPAWTAGGTTGTPGWCKSTGSSKAPGAPRPEYDFPTGSVMSYGPSEVWWTASSSQRVTISGGVWLLRRIGRSQHWYIKLNNTEITAGDLFNTNLTINSRSPLSFETGSKGPSALIVNVVAGDVLKFGATPLAPNRSDDYVGYDISLAFGESVAPPIIAPPVAGFIGCGTPGRLNSVGAEPLPPLVDGLTHFPDKPASTNDVLVTARVQGEAPLESVQLKTMMNAATNETWLEMFDDGLHGDGVANDGVFGVWVPARASQTLVHYQVVATDTRGVTTQFPYADDPSPTQAYFHYNGEINTRSTLFHLFIPTANLNRLNANPRSDDYVDCSLVIDHIAYPHVGARYRGRRSRDDPKRPWKFQFNKDHLYKTNRTYDTMYSIPLEQKIAFELFDSAGIDNLQHELVRLHINGSFWGVYIGFESPTGRWLGKHGHHEGGEVYKGRTVETPAQWKNSDLFHNQIVTDYDYWGAYNKKVRPLEPPDSLRELVDALNDMSDAQLLPWLDAHVDLDQWFKRWALNVCMNIDDFTGHNYYLFLPGEPGGKWKMLGYDFDSGFTFGRVGQIRALYGDGGGGDNPAWQRGKLYQRVSTNPTLRRIYLLTLRKMVRDVMKLEVIIPRIRELFTLMTPDRTADLARWSTIRTSINEATNVLTSQRRSLSNFLALASTGLPSPDKTPALSLANGEVQPGTTVSLTTQPGWLAYVTLDGSDPRLSLSRQLYTEPISIQQAGILRAAAILPVGQTLANGNWTDLAEATFTVVPRPRLIARAQGLSLQLSWAAPFTNHILEAATAIQGPWIGASGPQTQVGNEIHVGQSLSGPTRFFRLRER